MVFMAARALAGPISASAQLRASTRGEHAAVEAGLDLRQLRHATELAALLHGWGAIWAVVRAAVTATGVTPAATEELLLPSTQALGWLNADLADLRAKPDRPETEIDAAIRVGAAGGSRLRCLLEHQSGSWGVAYVLRGSRLGGTVLAPLVRAALGLRGDCGTRFLASSGTDPGREWVSFRRRLDSVDLPPPELAAAVDAARWTFRWVGAGTAATFAGPAGLT